MNAITTAGARNSSRSATYVLRCASALLASALLAAAVEASAQEPVAAVWQPRKLSFSYSSASSIFSCSALAARVSSILRAVGARDDVQVKASGCSEAVPPLPSHSQDRATLSTWDPMSDHMARGSDGRQYVNVYVRLMVPTEVTPEVLAELKKDKSRRELVSRVTGNAAARFNDPVMFNAQWQPVTLSRKTIGITTEECELLEQMTPGVFRQLGMRVVRSGAVCSEHSQLPPEMVVEALLAAPYPGTAAPAAPAAPAGKDDAAEPAAPGAAEPGDAAERDAPTGGQ